MDGEGHLLRIPAGYGRKIFQGGVLLGIRDFLCGGRRPRRRKARDETGEKDGEPRRKTDPVTGAKHAE